MRATRRLNIGCRCQRQLHLEIRAKIGNDAFEFPDIDVYGKPGDTAIGHGSLAPGASYTQKMRFYAGSAKEGTDGGWEKAKKRPPLPGAMRAQPCSGGIIKRT